MAEAESELAKLYPEHADMVRAERKKLEGDESYTPDFDALISKISKECQECELMSKDNPGPRKYKPYAWTACEAAHPVIQRKIMSCAAKIERRQTCPESEWGTSKSCVNPYAVCRTSIKCPDNPGNPGKRLPTPLQIEHLKKLFDDLNPGTGVDVVDWEATADGSLTYEENVGAFAEEYPQYTWTREQKLRPRLYEEQIVRDAQAQVGEFSYDVVKGYKLKELERGAARAGKLKAELEECQEGEPRRPGLGPGVCKIKTVPVVAHLRCPPRVP